MQRLITVVRLVLGLGALLAAGSAAAQPASRAVAFERECLDLDAGAALPCDEGDPTWDVLVAYNALAGVHAVVAPAGDREGAVLEGASFAAVTLADADTAVFTADTPEAPMDGGRVLLVRSDLGATFKVDVSSEDASHATVLFEDLGGGAQ